MALRNISLCVKAGFYESRFISPDPCKFIQGGMIERGLSDEYGCAPYEKNDPNLRKMRDD
jgi:hypothetical protein